MTEGWDPIRSTRALSKADPVMASIIKRAGPLTLEPEPRSPYESLFRSIVYQQLTGKAAGTILKRVLALFPRTKFPKPEQVFSTPDEAFRSAGLSRSKTAAIKDLAAHAAEGKIPSLRQTERMSNEELIELLTQVRGIGPWTVEMFLIFTLGRPDVLPVSDYGVRKGYAVAYGKKELPTPKQLLTIGESWAPYRSIAAWYLWRVLEFPKPTK